MLDMFLTWVCRCVCVECVLQEKKPWSIVYKHVSVWKNPPFVVEHNDDGFRRQQCGSGDIYGFRWDAKLCEPHQHHFVQYPNARVSTPPHLLLSTGGEGSTRIALVSARSRTSNFQSWGKRKMLMLCSEGKHYGCAIMMVKKVKIVLWYTKTIILLVKGLKVVAVVGKCWSNWNFFFMMTSIVVLNNQM